MSSSSSYAENLESYHALRFNKDGLRELSNFDLHDFDFMGHTFHSAEAAFQACKLIDDYDLTRFEEHVDEFICCNPSAAKKLGKRVELCSNWEKVKAERMYAILTEKFKQNPGLLHTLLNTDERFIMEDNTWHDNTWGICTCRSCWSNKTASNILGLLLMKLRAELREERDCKVKYWLKGEYVSSGIGYINLMDSDDIASVFSRCGVSNMNEFMKRMV